MKATSLSTRNRNESKINVCRRVKNWAKNITTYIKRKICSLLINFGLKHQNFGVIMDRLSVSQQRSVKTFNFYKYMLIMVWNPTVISQIVNNSI